MKEIDENKYKDIEQELKENAKNLQVTLYNLEIEAKVEEVLIGPVFITYGISLFDRTRINDVKNVEKEIALCFGVENISIKRIPGKTLLGIEVERKNKELVEFKEIIESDEFKNSTSNLTVELGKDAYGKCRIIDLKETSHILVSGTLDSGRSMFLHVLINSIMCKAKPNEVKFMIIDTDVLELSKYNGNPHLLIPVITEYQDVVGALAWICQEMDNRYEMLRQDAKMNDMDEYNEGKDENQRVSDIVLIIDDCTGLIEPDFEKYIYKLSQKGREVGIYLILVAGSPLPDRIDEIMDANIPTRIAFKLRSQEESKKILDMGGAEKLLGKGDMLFKELGRYRPVRYQVSFISNKI